MANMFALILTLATLVTGIFWCLDKFRWAPARQRKVEAVRVQTDGKVDGKLLARVGNPPTWLENITSSFPILALVFVVRSFIYEPFQIPSGSMMQTLLIGDFIAVQKFSYGIKEPITNSTLIKTGQPQRGDIAVFKFPKDIRIDYVKRIVGLPGDTVIYDAENKTLSIKPACLSREECPETLDLNYSQPTESDFIQQFEKVDNYYATHFYNKNQLESETKGAALPLLVRKEKLAEASHDILVLPRQVSRASDYFQQQGQPPGQWVVPEGHYFVLGDNRDNSEDSRYWGFVPEKNLVGKATTIWMSFEKQPNEWPTGFRFSRIGSIH